jgi:uncharacterized protein (TIGR02118 family)
MAKLIALYRHPPDTAAFESYYFSTHAALVRKLPGLKRFEVSRRPVASPQGTPYHFAAIMEFDSIEALDAAMRSPEGQAAAADVGRFAPAGTEVLVIDTKSI